MLSPTTNFVLPNPTVICHQDQNYWFEGYSLFTHYKLDQLPTCQLLRFNLLYDIYPVEEDYPEVGVIVGAMVMACASSNLGQGLSVVLEVLAHGCSL